MIVVILEGGNHMTERVKVNKEIYIWAIQQSKRSFEEVEARFENIAGWISQEVFPTFRQVEDLANFLKVPFGYMFLEHPPKTNVMESEFRTVGNKIPKRSKNLEDTLYNIGRKRDWLRDYRKEKGWERLIPESLLNIESKDIAHICIIAKNHLNIDEFWYRKYNDPRTAFNYLRGQLEHSGVVVMQSGVVGFNNHRKLNVDEFRGFLLYDDIAPIIFINSNDSMRGRIFTLIHEYIHFLLRKDDIFIEEDAVSKNETERFVNQITAEFLMPKHHIEEQWDDNEDHKQQIQELIDMFHISAVALAIQLKNMNKINQETVVEVKKHTDTIWQENKGARSGGNYYHTVRSRFGNSFLSTVIQSGEAGEIRYTDAFRLLDNSVKAYDYFKEEFV